MPVPIKLYTCFQAFQVQSGFMPKSSFSQIKMQPSREKLCIALTSVTARLTRQLINSKSLSIHAFYPCIKSPTVLQGSESLLDYSVSPWLPTTLCSGSFGSGVNEELS